MRKIDVTTGKWHVVEGDAGSTVINPKTGKAIATVEEGKQASFLATTPYVEASDDSVKVYSANFNQAPVKLRLLGLLGGGVSTGLPSGYLAAEFLECNNGKYIWTDLLMKNDRGIEVVYEYTANSGVSLPMYAGMSGGGLYCRVSHPTDNVGLWWDKRYAVKSILSGKVRGTVNFKNDRKITNGEYSANITYTPTAAEEEIKVNVRIAQSYTGLLYSFRFSEGSNVVADLTPALDPQGSVCMFDRVKKKTYFFTSSSGNQSQPVIGMTLKQARKLGKLPAGGGELTVSLPWEALDDAKVQAALAKAAENGWTIIEQYREPDATTENIEADFLEGTGEQKILLSGNVDKNTGVEIDYQQTKTETTILCEFIGTRVTYNYYPCYWFVPRAETAAGTRVEWYYFKSRFNRGRNAYDRVTVQQNYLNSKKCYIIERSGKTQSVNLENIADDAVYPAFTLFNNATRGKIWSVNITQGDKVSCKLIPIIDSDGVPCMFDKVGKQPFKNSGTKSFVVGFETVETARRLAKLPKVEAGELTVSLPAEARDAASMVPTALSIAASRGWTIIEQYRED